MKKIILLLIITFSFFSCTQEVEFNNPSMQGVVDELDWKALDYTVTVDANQRLVIEGHSQFETIVLKTSSINPGTYILGLNNLNTATYTLSIDGNVKTYTTENNGNGSIYIENSLANTGQITGTFKFNAINNLGETVTISKGILYKVPIGQ